MTLQYTRYNPEKREIWPWPMVLLEKAGALIDKLPGKLWLDAACGEGQLADNICNTKELVGIDISFEKLKIAESHSYADLVYGSVIEIPFSNNSFDGIATIETLEHIEALDQALMEFQRCLRPGGYLLASMPSVTLRTLYDMHITKKPVYCSEAEHVRELSSIQISRFPNMFATWSWLERQFFNNRLELIQSGGVGYLFPMFQGRLSILEKGMNLLYRENVNKFLGRLPQIHNFPYYRTMLFQTRK